MLKMRERLERQEQELAKLRKALTYEKLVVKTAQRIIRRNTWGPFPGSDAKKKICVRRGPRAVPAGVAKRENRRYQRRGCTANAGE